MRFVWILQVNPALIAIENISDSNVIPEQAANQLPTTEAAQRGGEAAATRRGQGLAPSAGAHTEFGYIHRYSLRLRPNYRADRVSRSHAVPHGARLN